MKIKFLELTTQITQDKKKLFFAIIVIVIILYLDTTLVLKTQWAAIKAINPKIVKIKNDLKNFDSDYAQLQTFSSQSVSSKTKQVILAEKVSWLMEEIYRLGKQSNVSLIQVNPLKDAKATSAVARFSPLLLELEISGGYHALIKFLHTLENHSVFMAIEDLEIERTQKDIFSHQIRLTLRTYVRKK